ncbi:hypothetical protein ACTMTI_52830 [Nonomuraea sp. H19]
MIVAAPVAGAIEGGRPSTVPSFGPPVGGPVVRLGDGGLDMPAGLLLGACFQFAFLGHMSPSGQRDDKAAAAFAHTLLESLAP